MTYPSTVKHALLAKETTWGTRVAPTKSIGLVISDIGVPINREIIESNGISAIQTQKITTGMIDPGVTMEGDIQHGRLFEFIIGSVAHNTTSLDTEHTFTISDTPPSASLAIENNLTTDAGLEVYGSIVESAELSIALNENLKLSCEFKGKTFKGNTTIGTESLSTLQVFPHNLVQVKLADVQATEVQSASISINKVVERSGGIGSNIYQQGHATELKFEFSANLGFSSANYYKLFAEGTLSAVTANPETSADPTGTNFEIVGDNGTALGSGQRKVQLKLSDCQYGSFNETTSVGGLTFIEVTGIGLLDTCVTVDNIESGSW